LRTRLRKALRDHRGGDTWVRTQVTAKELKLLLDDAERGAGLRTPRENR